MSIRLTLSPDIKANGRLSHLQNIVDRINNLNKFLREMDDYHHMVKQNANSIPDDFSFNEVATVAFFQTVSDQVNTIFLLTAHHIWKVILGEQIIEDSLSYVRLIVIESPKFKTEGLFSGKQFLSFQPKANLKLYFDSKEDKSFLETTFTNEMNRFLNKERAMLTKPEPIPISEPQESTNNHALENQNKALIETLNLENNETAIALITLSQLKYPKNKIKPLSSGDIPLGFQFIENDYVMENGLSILTTGGAYEKALQKVIKDIRNLIEQKNADGAFNLCLTHAEDESSSTVWVYAYFDIAKRIL